MAARCDVMADARHNQGLCLGGWGANYKVLNDCADAGHVKVQHNILISGR